MRDIDRDEWDLLAECLNPRNGWVEVGSSHSGDRAFRKETPRGSEWRWLKPRSPENSHG